MARGTVRNPSGYVSTGRSAADKASKFAETVKDHGWTGKWTADESTGVTHLFTRRGENETIDIWWLANGSLDLDHLPIYTLAGERIKLKNVSAAVKMAASQTDTERLTKNVRRQRRKLNGGSTPEDAVEILTSAQGSLPFDHESTDAELKAVLFGKAIAWINTVSGQTYSAIVGGAKAFRIIRKNGAKDQITFVDDYGYHCVYLNSIVSVG